MTTLTPVPPQSAPVLTGAQFSRPWSGWFRNLYNYLLGFTGAVNAQLSPGITVTVTLAALTTPGGTQGSITVTKGIVTHYVAPT